jgi:hypothetical protein
MTAVSPAPPMPPCVRAAFAAAVRVENELTSYELGAAPSWTRHEEAIKAETAAKDAAMHVEQLGLLVSNGSVLPKEQLLPTVGELRQDRPPYSESDVQLLLSELIRSDAECRRLSSACNKFRQQADRTANEHAQRLQLADEASARRHAAMEAELIALRRSASEAAASLRASRADASVAVTETGALARRVDELQESIRALQPLASAASTTAAQLTEARSKASALEALARRGAEDSVALIEAKYKIRKLERDANDRKAALELAEAELAKYRGQAAAAATCQAQLDQVNREADALRARLEAAAADGADLAVARARIDALEARLESLSYGEPGMAGKPGDVPCGSGTAVRAEVSVGGGGAVSVQLHVAPEADGQKAQGWCGGV